MNQCRRLVSIVCLVVLGLGQVALSPAGAGSPPAGDLESWVAAPLELETGGIAADPARGTVLVSVSDQVPMLGNHLVELDPATGAPLRSVHVGSGPTVVAVDPAGTVAYVAVEHSGEIVQVALADFSVTARFAYEPAATADWRAVTDIAVQPNNAEVIVVAFEDGGGVAVFDGGVRLAETWTNVPLPDPPLPWMTVDPPERIAFVDDEHLVGLVGHGFIVDRLVGARIDASGLVEERVVGDVTSPASLGLVATNGLVHLGYGQVVDPADGHVVRHDPSAGAIGADPDGATVYFAGNDRITARSTTDGAEVGQVSIETAPNGRLVMTSAGAVLGTRAELRIYGPDATATGFVLPDPPAPTLDWAGAVALDVNAIRVVAAPDGSSFFAVGGYVDPTYPSHVVEIDATTGDIVRSAFIGALVSSLDVSLDGSTLIATSGLTHEVTEIDTATFDINRRVTLQGTDDPGYGGDILPLPGDADRYLVVTWSNVNRNGSVVDLLLVDDGIAASVPQPFGPPARPSQLVLDEANPTTVWAHEANSGDLHRLVDDGQQFAYTEEVDFLCCFSWRLEWSDGSLYTSSGYAADVDAGRQTGKYPAGGVVLPLPEHDRTLVFGSNVTEMDLDGYQQLESYDLPVLSSGRRGVVTDVARIGDLLAVTYENGPTLLVPFVGTAPPAPTGSPPPPRCLTGFPDVLPDHPFCHEIAWLSALTVTETSYGEAYRPGDQVTRQALAAMLYRMAGRPGFHAPTTPTFPDVTDGPFLLAVEWAASYGLFNGYPDGTFGPTTPVSRQAAAAVLHRSVGSPAPASATSFADVPANHPFRVSIQWMAAAGIANGYTDGTFGSALPISRQAAAAFIIRTLQPQVAATFSGS